MNADTYYEMVAATSRPDGITDRMPTALVPTVQQYQLAAPAISIAVLFSGRDRDVLADVIPRMVVRYLIVRRAAFMDALWCGVPHLAGHLAARAVVDACAVDERTAGDEALVQLAQDLITAVWGDGVVRTQREPVLRAALALRRHISRCGYAETPTKPRLVELAKIGTAENTLVAIQHLIRAVVHSSTFAGPELGTALAAMIQARVTA